MITGVVVLNLRRSSESLDRRELGVLYGVPAGTKVILEVGDRTFAHPWTVEHVRQYVDRLHFEVQGSVAAVEAWVGALRNAAYGTTESVVAW